MAKKEHLLIQTDDMLLSESYKNIQYNFLTNQFILFSLNLIFENDFFKICSFK